MNEEELEYCQEALVRACFVLYDGDGAFFTFPQKEDTSKPGCMSKEVVWVHKSHYKKAPTIKEDNDLVITSDEFEDYLKGLNARRERDANRMAFIKTMNTKYKE